MDRFIIHLGKIKFHIEPLSNEDEDDAIRQFKIYEDDNVFFLNAENVDDMPPDHFIGTLTIHDRENPKDFDFSGSGKISGEELIEISELIIEHLDKGC